jgi:hypothetical protein
VPAEPAGDVAGREARPSRDADRDGTEHADRSGARRVIGQVGRQRPGLGRHVVVEQQHDATAGRGDAGLTGRRPAGDR